MLDLNERTGAPPLPFQREHGSHHKRPGGPSACRALRLGFCVAFMVLPSCARKSVAPPPPPSEDALRIHHESIVVDGHNDISSILLDLGFDLGMDGSRPGKRDITAYWVPPFDRFIRSLPADELRTDTDLRRLRSGGVDAVFFSIFVDRSYANEPGASRRRALDMIAAVLAQVDRHPESLTLATTASGVRDAARDRKVAVLLGLEGGHAIEDSLVNLRQFHRLGVRYMTLTWYNATSWADSSEEHPHGGLTSFGREVVREMNRLGMLVDISHVSDETFFDAVETSLAPVIASHSSARALVDRPRNMSDEMLRTVARNGGVVMVNSQDPFIDPRKATNLGIVWQIVRHFGWPETPLANYIDHLDHVARVAGIDHVGLGSDFACTFMHPNGFRDVADFPNVTASLLRRGYSEEDVGKILGGNLLRVLATAEQVSVAGTVRQHQPATRLRAAAGRS